LLRSLRLPFRHRTHGGWTGIRTTEAPKGGEFTLHIIAGSILKEKTGCVFFETAVLLLHYIRHGRKLGIAPNHAVWIYEC
jgi:hypothetical protein